MVRTTTSSIPVAVAVGFALSCAAPVMAKPPETRYSIEHSFTPEEGQWPGSESTFVKGPGHLIYSVLSLGGPHGNGTAFSFNIKNGRLKVLHAFSPDEVSDVQPSAIVVGPGGEILVTTYQGGAVHIGTISRLEDDGSMTVVHDFDGDGGGLPIGPLAVIGDSLVGTTGSGPAGFGSVYRFRVNGEFEQLHAFESQAVSYEESFPFGVTPGPNGTLYGATYGYIQPQALNGALYSLTAAGVYQVLHYFSGPDGSRPFFAPIFADNGDLFGTTTEGGEFGCGVIYRVQLPATFTVVHSFNSETDGCAPFGGLIKSANGKLYGIASYGGSLSSGTFFEVTSGGTFRKLLDFDALAGQGGVQSQLLEVEPGTFYGGSPNGGRYGLGNIFRIKVK